MTGGGDLDEGEHEILDESADVADEDDDVAGEIDELGGTGDGEADTPVGTALKDINKNDPDPTAGASDVGGLPGSIDEDQTGR